MRDLSRLIEKIEELDGPSRKADGAIGRCLAGGVKDHWYDHLGSWVSDDTIPAYTASLDAAIALVERVLPGWWWKVGTCCVSDDACIAPDFNSPIHGERLKEQFFPLVPGSEFDAGFDVDRRPPGNVPIALITALLLALRALQSQEKK